MESSKATILQVNSALYGWLTWWVPVVSACLLFRYCSVSSPSSADSSPPSPLLSRSIPALSCILQLYWQRRTWIECSGALYKRKYGGYVEAAMKKRTAEAIAKFVCFVSFPLGFRPAI